MKTGISDSGLNLTQDRFLQLPVPLPSIVEQLRIVEILENHLSRLDAAERNLKEAAAKTMAWVAGTYDHWIWGQSFPVSPVWSLLRESMRNGRSDRASGDDSGVRTLTLSAVTQNEFSDRFTKHTMTAPSMAEDLWLAPGDVLVQRSNTPQLVGTAARYDGPDRWAIFPDLLIRLRPNEGVIDGRFFVAALQTERTHRTLRSKAKGLAGSMPKIDQTALGETLIPVPPVDRQGELVARLDEANAGARNFNDTILFAKKRSAMLKSSVLIAAFEGRLTGGPTDDEVIEEMAGV